ncbi:hypothetical protein [Pseudomonas entomophila]|uniref:hypothetical protein n=1 Tax=Pseudomonas entomophila TaxID=312306 RepID=UPI00200DF1D4|nr:hypothetical protein [Pseudomonas entomophila]
MSISPNPVSSALPAAENETKSHQLLKAHSFPTNSIGPMDDERPWKCDKPNSRYATRTDADGNPYVELLEGLELWQDFEIHAPAKLGPEGRPEYLIECQYNIEKLRGCRLQVFLITEAGPQRDPFFDEPLGITEKDVTWQTFSLKRINVVEVGTCLRIKFKIPGDENGYERVFLRNVLTELRLPAFDDVG